MSDWYNRFSHQPINGHSSGLKYNKKKSIKNILSRSGIIFAAVIVITFIIALVWYNILLSPLGGDSSQLKKITIEPGSNSMEIGKELKKRLIIRSSTAFDIYTRITGKNSTLQAGTYQLSSAESVPEIVEHFIKGSVDQFSITFFPGATLTDNTSTSDSKKYDVTTVLKNAGYSQQEITSALNDNYDSPLFEGKPDGTDSEGYIFGETYNFNIGASVHEIFQRTFDEFYAKLQENNLITAFNNHGLNLYQAITLASIIQREVGGEQDQRQVAQVFYLRLSLGMVLGSDVTYQYITDKNGVERDPSYDSPYNTRIYKGLPFGPISVPSMSALLAVAFPTEGDYLYFLSGDDGKTYFGRTEEDHQSNIINHCVINCSKP